MVVVFVTHFSIQVIHYVLIFCAQKIQKLSLKLLSLILCPCKGIPCQLRYLKHLITSLITYDMMSFDARKDIFELFATKKIIFLICASFLFVRSVKFTRFLWV